MTDLAAFLAAQLDEDEAAAKAVHIIDTAPWHTLEWYDGDFEGGATARVDLRSRTGAITDQGALPRPVGAHIARWDPARVLAEVAAKRKLLKGHEAVHRCDWGEHRGGELEPCMRAKLLAASYADHPNYDPAWSVA